MPTTARQTNSHAALGRGFSFVLIVAWGIGGCLLSALPEAEDTHSLMLSVAAGLAWLLFGGVFLLYSLYEMLRLRPKGVKRLGLIAAFVVAAIGSGKVSHELARRLFRTLPPYMPRLESQFEEHREAYQSLVKRVRSGEKPSERELSLLNLKFVHLDEETGDVELFVFSRKKIVDQDAFGFAFLDAAPEYVVDEVEKNMPEAPEDHWGRAYEEIGDGWYYFIFRLTS